MKKYTLILLLIVSHTIHLSSKYVLADTLPTPFTITLPHSVPFDISTFSGNMTVTGYIKYKTFMQKYFTLFGGDVTIQTDFEGYQYIQPPHGSRLVDFYPTDVYPPQESDTTNSSGRWYITGPDSSQIDFYRLGNVTNEPIQLPVPFLSFPLISYTPYTKTINTVFDHSMTIPYCADGIIVAYTGENATDLSKNGTCNTYNDPETFSYPPGPTSISNYSQEATMSYDGHSGYDYRTIDMGANTDVLAAAAGTGSLGSYDYGEVIIDHGNGYRTRYLHLRNDSRLTDSRIINGHVEVGIPIGTAGGTGPSGPNQFPIHLHFELQKYVNSAWTPVDPYGWNGSSRDPYTAATNVKLWIENPLLSVGSNSSFLSIQNAYDSVTTDGQSIQMQTQTFNENLDFSNNVLVTLLGGYDPNFQTQSGWTTIFGSLIIRSGTVIIDYICIQ